MRGRERREGRGEEVRAEKGREGERRAVEGREMEGCRAGEGGKGSERTTLPSPCRKFLATPLASAVCNLV